MSKESLDVLFLGIGALCGSFTGWIFGKVIYDLDNGGKSNKYLSRACGVAVGTCIAFALPLNFAWLACLFVYPAAKLCEKLMDILENAPELDKPCNYFRTDAEIAASNQTFDQLCSLIGTALACMILSAVMNHHFAVAGGVLACLAGALILPIPSMGMIFLVCILATCPLVFIPRFFKSLTLMGVQISSYIRRAHSK